METGYTVNEGKHTSLLEDGFMPVETALEVPVQEQRLVNINKLRKKHGLDPIQGGDKDFISTK